MTFEEAVKGSKAPEEVIGQLELLDVQYYGIDEKLHQGQIMVNKAISQKIREIFEVILEERFPINKVVPMVYYDWDDDKSMEDNNSSAFCYRVIAGTDKISQHSFGMAVDINPKFNPLTYTDGRCLPASGKYDTSRLGTLLEGSKIVRAFEERGFLWRGRNRNKYDDLHHFDIVL